MGYTQELKPLTASLILETAEENRQNIKRLATTVIRENPGVLLSHMTEKVNHFLVGYQQVSPEFLSGLIDEMILDGIIGEYNKKSRSSKLFLLGEPLPRKVFFGFGPGDLVRYFKLNSSWVSNTLRGLNSRNMISEKNLRKMAAIAKVTPGEMLDWIIDYRMTDPEEVQRHKDTRSRLHFWLNNQTVEGWTDLTTGYLAILTGIAPPSFSHWKRGAATKEGSVRAIAVGVGKTPGQVLNEIINWREKDPEDVPVVNGDRLYHWTSSDAPV